MTNIAIRVSNLSKRYRIGARRVRHDTLRDLIITTFKRSNFPRKDDHIWALKDVSFEVNHGEIVGIIGRNGVGKSTLLKILSRITEPTEGWVEIRGRVGSLLEVGTGFHPELTGRENIFLNGVILGMKKMEIERKSDEIIAFSELNRFIDTPVKHYSSGMYVRLAFAVAAHLEPEILLVDEVLAVGDAAFQQKCLGKIEDVAKEGRTVLLVSHNMAAIQHMCSKALLLVMGQLAYSGRTPETIDFYERHVLLSEKKNIYPPHIIFDSNFQPDQPQSDFEIVRIEITDIDNAPKPIVSTWDAVKFRISYTARHNVQAGSAVLQISTRHGVPLLFCSTQPDFKVLMPIKPGRHTVECEFEALPLSAGEYVVGAGLAIPNIEWLYWRENLGLLTVQPKDVYRSGMAPIASRSIIATPHVWRVYE